MIPASVDDDAAQARAGAAWLVSFYLASMGTFYRDTLQLLKLEVDVLKMGDFKGAVEPFTRDSLSKENREQIESMLNDNFDREIVAAGGRTGHVLWRTGAGTIQGAIVAAPTVIDGHLFAGSWDQRVYAFSASR